MHITKINNINNYRYNISNNFISKVNSFENTTENQPLEPKKSYIDYSAYAKINFRAHGEFANPNRTVANVEYEEYKAMNESTKLRYRKRYKTFHLDSTINKNELFDKKSSYMPLQTERNMDEFLKTASIYKKYKDQPIICLGRSPKWFLNAALWMEDGIESYKFVAFSDRWYTPDPEWGVRKLKSKAPTEKETIAYKKYLKNIKADPKTIVENMEKTGKKTVITDYICSGKGASSFLEIMADYANDLGILEEFSKSIQIVGIGSMEYLEDLNPYADSISVPRVHMPENLRPYAANVEQTFYNMDYSMFCEMLLNQNVNECRSTYYPPQAWTIYKPDKFKTGLIKDMNKVKEVRSKLKDYSKIAHFTPAMSDFRNLLNFRILDSLNTRKLLKSSHITRV